MMAPVAQLVERQAYVLQVVGSIPTRSITDEDKNYFLKKKIKQKNKTKQKQNTSYKYKNKATW